MKVIAVGWTENAYAQPMRLYHIIYIYIISIISYIISYYSISGVISNAFVKGNSV